ncbi:diacylglycerol O-acyltransferase 3-like [Bidens hawaiensis]|uniref:diacylglycerol O-acyltransferase 3-like n=1 Tax=Bidens hawaiensis TaxID=980011 RepID=UPI00404B584D
MEVAGAVFRQSPCFSSTAADSRQSIIKPNSIRVKQRKWVVVSGEYSDKGHLQYYERVKKKEVKKKLKVLKGLSKNLNTFNQVGFCLDPGCGLDQQVKGKMISEATEVLLGQLQKLKEEKMESKRIKKEEKAKKKAMMKKTDCKDSSSSESSSSESDCDNVVVNMSKLKTVTTSNTNQEPTSSSSSVQVLEKPENIVITDTAVDCGKKIEVCMGGKCKKSGAATLLETFQAAVGGDAVAVVGCKCMGKCREGPNVKVHTEEEEEAAALRNPMLCIGVGLEDVDTIVANFFGGSDRSCSVMVPALT